MTGYPDPSSWMDAVTIIVVALFAAVPSWLTIRASKSIHKSVGEVREQVVNGHTSPMRADLDEMRVALSNLRDEVRGGFSSLRADLAEERSARRDGDLSTKEEIITRIEKDFARRFPPG